MGAGLYQKHSAFNKSLEQEPKESFDPLEESNHHNPSLLKKVHQNDRLSFWFSHLYKAGQILTDHLLGIDNKINSGNKKLNKKEIFEVLQLLKECHEDIDNFRHDIAEYNRYMLSTDILFKDDNVQSLYEQLRYIDLLEQRIITVGDRKLSEINNRRMQLFSLFLSIIAIVVSIYSILLSSDSNNIFETNKLLQEIRDEIVGIKANF
ncbi:emp24/gp25L/p24 family protein [Bacillus piscicola]|uniref:emp24/gp25L/p24 family protein n=1 Tax=Bacillus piscicola TaxID=1632684 RepID=UPI001F090801|nr:emp24/gp25L/p24 family protein [Bacillus piscicola]